MEPQWSETIKSINGYVHELHKGKDKSEITLAVFDLDNGFQYDVLRHKCKPADWKDLAVNEAKPRGLTPLYDAIGKLAREALAEDRDRSAIVVMTDGYENASTEISRDKAKEYLDKCRSKGWQVVFLGANFDAMPQAKSMGVQVSSTLNIRPESLVRSMASLAGATMTYTSSGQNMAFSDADRKLAGFAGKSS